MTTMWNRVQTGLLVLVLLALLAVIGMLASDAQGGPLDPPGQVASTDGVQLPGTPITAAPFNITAGGNYYLTRDVQGVSDQNGINVTTGAGVTIDLNGFALRGPAGVPTLDGIRIAVATQNLTIRNGTVSGWAGDGIDAPSTRGLILEDVHVSDNAGAGIRVGDDANIQDCTVADHGGAGIQTGARAIIRGCNVSNNGGGGITVGFRSAVHDCNASDNVGIGISLGAYGAIENCVASNNTGTGIVGFLGVAINGCTAQNNGGAGLSLGDDVVVAGCASRGNAGYGIISGNNGNVSDCTASDNTIDGVKVGLRSIVGACVAYSNNNDGFELGEGSRITDVTATDNGAIGIRLGGDSHVRNCTVQDNTSQGILALNVSRVSVDSCIVSRNGFTGISLGASSHVSNSTSEGNLTGYAIHVQASSLIENNLAQSAVNHAIIAGGGQATIVRNKAQATGAGTFYGIVLDGGVGGARIEGNHVRGSSTAISITSQGNLVIGNFSSQAFTIAAGNMVGPVITEAGLAGNTNPAANYRD